MSIPPPTAAGAGSAAERFLRDFHAARPGLTSKAFAGLPVQGAGRTFPSSYDMLADTVPAALPAQRVLDLACGDGHLLGLLARRAQPGLALWGIDMSPAELGLARQHLGDRALLCCAKAQALPLPDACLDHVLCHLALMLMDDARQVLREIRRVLRPGGQLAAIVGAPPPPSTALTLYLDLLRSCDRQAPWQDVRLGDRRMRDAAGLRELLAPAFHEVAIEDVHITHRLSPEALWDWFMDMYDLHLLGEEDRASVGHAYRAALAPHCGADGKVEYREALRFVRATAVH